MEPTNLQVFVAEVKGTGESEYMGIYKQVPLRLRADIFAEVEAFQEMMAKTQKFHVTRSLMIFCELLLMRLKTLDEGSMADFNMHASHYYNDFTGSGDLADDEVSK